jgi:hypothetical protein
MCSTSLINRNTVAIRQTDTIIELSLSHSLIGTEFEIICSTSLINRNAVAILQTDAIIELK